MDSQNTPPLINTLAQSTRRHIPPATPPRPVGMPGVIRYAAFRYCCGSYVCSMRLISYVCSIPLREVAIPPPPLPFEQVYVEQVFESATLPLLEQVFEYDTQRIESPSVGVWVGTCVRVTVCYLCSLYPVSHFFRTSVRCSGIRCWCVFPLVSVPALRNVWVHMFEHIPIPPMPQIGTHVRRIDHSINMCLICPICPSLSSSESMSTTSSERLLEGGRKADIQAYPRGGIVELDRGRTPYQRSSSACPPKVSARGNARHRATARMSRSGRG